MPNKTTNFALNQWAPEDDFLRTDFNEDNAKIESALTELNAQISGVGYVFGSYTGNSTYPRTITLGFQPKIVLLFSREGKTYFNGIFGGLLGAGYPLQNGSTIFVQTTTTGFQLLRDYVNDKDYTYYYIAFK